MIAYITRCSYCVALTAAQWDKLDVLDYEFDVSNPLEKAGVVCGSVEYNGHFGRNIFFDLGPDDNGDIAVAPVLIALEAMLGAEA